MGRKQKNITNQNNLIPQNWDTTYNSYFTINYLKDIYDDSSECPWKINTYYFNDSGTFRALNNTPSNWSEEYKNCCIFIQNSFPECPPEWKPRTFYMKQNNRYILTESEPNNWSQLFINYYIQNSSTLNFSSCAEIFKVPEWNENISYRRSPRKDIQRSITHTGVVVSNFNNSSSL